MITDGQFVAAGPLGGSPYTLEQEALLFDSIETGWPIGHLTVWTPRGMSAGPWHVLDGHRRLHALAHAAAHVPVRLVRDLTNNAPQYRPVDAGIPDTWSIPVATLLRQRPFLRVARRMPRHIAARADAVAGRLLQARVDVVLLNGGSLTDIIGACGRLAPGRVSAATITHLRS